MGSKEAASVESNAGNPTNIVIATTGDKESGVKAPPIPKSNNHPMRSSSRDHEERQLIANRMKPKMNEQLQPEASTNLTTEAQASLIASAIDAETLRHFEKTQMLLRSFRNLPAGKDAASIEITDERERSRALLFQNILLRREANVKGVAPIEEVLSNVEPVLIDIANLPDKAPPAEIRAIRERIQRREIVATLQVYLTKPAIVGTITE